MNTLNQDPFTLLIVTEDSPESYSPAGERIRHLALASGSRFQKVLVLSLRATKKAANKHNQSESKSAVALYTINFSRAMPFPLSAFFDPVKMLMLLAHGLVIGRSVKPSCVIASMPPLETGTSAWLLSKFLHVPLVIDLRDDWESAVSTQLKRYFPSRLINLLSTVARKPYSSAYAILAVTETMIQTMRERRIRTRLLFVPNGADTTVFHLQPKETRARTRMENTLPVDKVIAVYCGSGANPYYRLDQVLSAISLLQRDLFDRLFFIFYVYNGHKYLSELKDQLELSDNYVEVRNPLPRRQLAEVLSACDIGLVPFDAKPYLMCARSTKMYEYLSAGLFVISSGPKKGELDSFFSENSDLGTFTLPSPPSFATALKQTAKDAENLLGESSRNLRYVFIRRNYDRKDIMRKVLNVLLTLAGKSEKATDQ